MLSSINSTKILFSLIFLILLSAIKVSSLQHTTLIEWEILQTNSTNLHLPILIDPRGLIFSATVFLISANVMWFSTTYMSGELNLRRFTILVNLFITSMNLLIFIPNLLCLLIGWDGLGLVSFLLVIFYQNHKSHAAGIITALSNRIGDVILLISISWAFHIDSWNLFSLNYHNSHRLLWITIILAAITKRAQMPFSAWLPAAIAAPTPVSALVHSSTLVTAGVFLLYRFHPLLSQFDSYFKTLVIISSITILIAGIVAITEIDIKKIIALSTLRQLGVIIFRLACNLPYLTFIHLITHALFKACLFICAGNLIHMHHHSQDLRLMGNSSWQAPVTSSCIIISNIALCAMPFIAGFYSKDIIIESAFSTQINFVIFMILNIATALTALYSLRLTKFVFISPIPLWSSSIVTDNEILIIKPIICLGTGAIIRGRILSWNFLPYPEIPILPAILKILPSTLVAASILYAFISHSKIATKIKTSSLYRNFSCSIWFLNFLRSQFIIVSPQSFAHESTKISDQRWTELMGPQGIYLSLSNSAVTYAPIQANYLNAHLIIILLSTAIVSALILYPYNLYKI